MRHADFAGAHDVLDGANDVLVVARLERFVEVSCNHFRVIEVLGGVERLGLDHNSLVQFAGEQPARNPQCMWRKPSVLKFFGAVIERKLPKKEPLEPLRL